MDQSPISCMKSFCTLTVIALCILSTSCQQRPRGRRHIMTTEDSLRRVAAIAEEEHLSEMDKIRETFIGPEVAAGTGVVSKGGSLRTEALGDSARIIIKSFDKFNARLTQASKDSTTPLGVLMSRFSVQDTMHKYMSATYSHDGHLLAFHSEITQDDRHKLAADFYFDKGKLIYYHERQTYTVEDDEQDAITDDSYFISGGHVMCSYRDDGRAPHVRDHMDLVRQSRFALTGDIASHVSRAFETFRVDYESLLGQQLESMVYTPPVKIQMPEVPATDKKVPTRGAGVGF